jgi:hypothetical protein
MDVKFLFDAKNGWILFQRWNEIKLSVMLKRWTWEKMEKMES